MASHYLRTDRLSLSALLPTLPLLVVLCAGSLRAADPVVSNVRASQRTGTKLVDVFYDLTDADSPTLMVDIKVSKDAGATWDVPCISTWGDGVGWSVLPGSDKHIIWDAGADWSGQWSDQMQVEITASDNELIRIPAGYFEMGDWHEDVASGSVERPVHTVFISAFQIGRFEVTKSLWDEVYGWAIENGYVFDHFGLAKGADHPVHSVSWYDVVKWCNARSQKEGLTPCYTVSGEVYRSGQQSDVVCNWSANGYRLPTEAEWEKAARGGLAGKRFPWGDTISHTQANYRSGNYGYEVSSTSDYHPDWEVGGRPYTNIVGSFPPNDYGLYDVAGNVLEWCWDWYSDTYYGVSPGTDPRGPGSGPSRINRSGYWNYFAYHCRCAYRSQYRPDLSFNFLGFRLVRAGQ